MKKRFSLFVLVSAVFCCLASCDKESGGGKEDNTGNTDKTQTVELKGIALDKHEVSLEKGDNTTLSVTFTPSDATDKRLTWDSSDSSVATVTDGKVTGKSPGTAEISAKSGNFSDKCVVTVVVSATAVSLDKNELSLNEGGSATLVATVSPSDATDAVAWASSDEAVATVADGVVTAVAAGTATITASAGTAKAECAVSVTVPRIVAVDLGLSVKWASCNLGASNPEEYGGHYAWGEIEPKDHYTWTTYKYCSDPFDLILSKYNTKEVQGPVDDKTVLGLEDDAAYVNLGGGWHIPTHEEWTELKTKCTLVQSVSNGVKGLKVTGPNGNSIFFPAAGDRFGPDLNNTGSLGFYWSSSLDTDNPLRAWEMDFYYDGSFGEVAVEVGWGTAERPGGQSVRPVTE